MRRRCERWIVLSRVRRDEPRAAVGRERRRRRWIWRPRRVRGDRRQRRRTTWITGSRRRWGRRRWWRRRSPRAQREHVGDQRNDRCARRWWWTGRLRWIGCHGPHVIGEHRCTRWWRRRGWWW